MCLIDYIQNSIMQIVKCPFRYLSFEISGFKIAAGQQADQIRKPSAAELVGESNTEDIAVIRFINNFILIDDPFDFLELRCLCKLGIIGFDLTIICRNL
jgi:hypothetical protein